MKLPDALWRHRTGMDDLVRVLDAARGQTRYVGGCVRDTLLGLPVADLDFATRLVPEEVMKRLRRANIRAVPTGLAHGTVTAVLPDGHVEITTLRRDVSTDGRRATVAYTDDWREDAARRDFTINALSADPITGEVHDYFDGAADLRARRVRFIGDPFVRIAEDHLRILRFFRFHARFGAAEPDADALEACTARANDLMALSRERIADELLKLLGLPEPGPTLALMVSRNILAPVLPEIDSSGVERLARLCARESALDVPAEPLRRLAALLPADPDVAASVGARLRLSNKATKRLVSAASPEGPTGDSRALAYRVGAAEAVDRLLLREEDMSALAAALSMLRGWERPRLAVSGGDIVAMGVEAGPLVAATMQAIEKEWVEAGFPADRNVQRAIARRHVAQAKASQ
jgi:poly(A) polymerase